MLFQLQTVHSTHTFFHKISDEILTVYINKNGKLSCISGSVLPYKKTWFVTFCIFKGNIVAKQRLEKFYINSWTRLISWKARLLSCLWDWVWTCLLSCLSRLSRLLTDVIQKLRWISSCMSFKRLTIQNFSHLIRICCWFLFGIRFWVVVISYWTLWLTPCFSSLCV